MVKIFDSKIERTDSELIVRLPNTWKGAEDENFRIVLDEICVIFPERVYDSIGEYTCLLYTSPSPRDGLLSRMPSSA